MQKDECRVSTGVLPYPWICVDTRDRIDWSFSGMLQAQSKQIPSTTAHPDKIVLTRLHIVYTWGYEITHVFNTELCNSGRGHYEWHTPQASAISMTQSNT